jgi:hypothetical protein
MNLYPEVEWKPWKFDKAPRNFWQDPTNQRKFLIDIQKDLQLKSPEDWYNVTTSQIVNLGGSGLLYLT